MTYNYIFISAYLRDVQTLDDWYRVSTNDIRRLGGATLLARYDNSLLILLSTVYPTHDWKFHERNTVKKGHWTDLSHRKEFLDKLAIKFSILTCIRDCIGDHCQLCSNRSADRLLQS
jgi:hypothetical protein